MKPIFSKQAIPLYVTIALCVAAIAGFSLAVLKYRAAKAHIAQLEEMAGKMRQDESRISEEKDKITKENQKLQSENLQLLFYHCLQQLYMHIQLMEQ